VRQVHAARGGAILGCGALGFLVLVRFLWLKDLLIHVFVFKTHFHFYFLRVVIADELIPVHFVKINCRKVRLNKIILQPQKKRTSGKGEKKLGDGEKIVASAKKQCGMG
jgi:hypothetical protein